MKFLEILLSFIATQGKSFVSTNTAALSQQIVNNARKVSILLVTIIIAITLFCVGFSLSFEALLKAIDLGEAWYFSASFWGGLVLTLVSLGVLIYNLGEARWLAATSTRAQEAPAEAAGPTIETAIALLLVELSQELKERRQHPHDQTHSGEAPQV